MEVKAIMLGIQSMNARTTITILLGIQSMNARTTIIILLGIQSTTARTLSITSLEPLSNSQCLLFVNLH
ncbi:Uncharacterized protein TCM_003534 [Theobroma cacao]|uniref:Uncharacterized protein n=1 Tax=Theobroma cacao TaxID=3641 RepID=A0A061DND4_THECC|nr:Uncharacterized protein TCM_003534 [Theobroma cacao]